MFKVVVCTFLPKKLSVFTHFEMVFMSFVNFNCFSEFYFFYLGVSVSTPPPRNLSVIDCFVHANKFCIICSRFSEVYFCLGQLVYWRSIFGVSVCSSPPHNLSVIVVLNLHISSTQIAVDFCRYIFV